MKLAVISYGRVYHSLEREAQIVNQMFRDGLELFHLRKPLHSVDELRAFLDRIEPRFLSRITLHSFHDLVLEYPVGGLHLSDRQRRKCSIGNRQVEFLLKIRSGLRQTHSYYKLDKLLFAPGKLDYVFLSPVFDSISKPFHRAAFSDRELSEVLARVKPPVFAVGGVRVENLAVLQRIGFYGASLHGAVWGSTDPNGVFRAAQAQNAPADIVCLA